MSCAAWAEPPVIRTSPPDIITTLSAPSTAAVLARHDRLCVAPYLLFIDATPDIPSAPVWSRHGPPQRRAGRKEGKPEWTVRRAHRLGSQVGPPAWPRKRRRIRRRRCPPWRGTAPDNRPQT